MKTRHMLSGIAVIFFALSCNLPPSPPGQATQGYGSSHYYISASYTQDSVGREDDGSRAWYFIPDVLKNGTSAPAVLFLHGYSALDPKGYKGHIEHLVKQGYIVIYPQFQLPLETGRWTDLDQNAFISRAVASVNDALNALGSQVERNSLVAYGQSLGGLLAFCWPGGQGASVQRIVMANANFDPTTGMPEFLTDLLTLIEFQPYAPAVTVPVIMLWGNEDDIASYPQQQQAYDLLVNAPSKVVYAAQSDDHGCPNLTADHPAAGQPADSKTGKPVEDAIDFRYYYAALDAALDGQDTLTFDMGQWSDGTPVKPVLQMLP